jgi:D-alanyl-D-alanine carboxypeptidase
MGGMSAPTGPRRSPGTRVAIHLATTRLLVLLLVALAATGVAASVVSASSLPSCRVADTLTVQRKTTDWNRTVLDTALRLPSSYAPGDLRSTANAGLNGGHQVRSLVIADLKSMASAAAKAGARLAVQSAYRSYATQASTFAYWTRVSGYAAAIKSSARAGHSEHQLGTTIDFRSYGGSAPWYATDWGTSKAGAWLKANAWKYGFVMSYPKGKSSVTCYAYEPWHYRYLGRAVAAKVHASKLTVREYLWRQQTTPPTPTPSPSPTGLVSEHPVDSSAPSPSAAPISPLTVEPAGGARVREPAPTSPPLQSQPAGSPAAP